MTHLIAILILSTTPEQMLTVHNRMAPQRTLDPCLCRAAQNYANLLARTGLQGHYADGKPQERAARNGFVGSMEFNERQGALYWDGGRWKRERVWDVGEVLAFGHPDADAAFEGWLDSTGHLAALLEASFDVVGFGHAIGRSGPVWIAMFGRAQ